MQKERTKRSSVSAVVLTNRVPVFWEWAIRNIHCIQIVVSAYFEKGKRAKIVTKVESKIWPRLSQKSVQACCTT